MITTERLILRPWKEEDLEPFARLTADPDVMEFFPAVLTKEESDALAGRFIEHFQKYGWGFWAAEVKGKFIGFIGLQNIGPEFSFAPAVEIGWRLAKEYWGKGYAVEGALAALNCGFNTLNLKEIVAFTTLTNMRSKRVMEKIGMGFDSEFDHPQLPPDHPLKRHLLYRIKKI